VLISLLAALTSTLRTCAFLQVEILALRHPLAVLQCNRQKRVYLGAQDRLLWATLIRLWPK
jgi:putative transposase